MAPGIADIVPVNYAEQAQTNIKSNSRTNPSSEDENSQDDLLISSPYTTAPHLLDLRSLDTPNRLLARALTVLTPIRDDYATAPYLDSFNWTAVFEYLRDLTEKTGHQWTRQTFYVVAFRSILYPDVDGERLGALDAHSHREATESGGLLKYWFGTKNAKRENLATCLWRNRDDARLGGTGPWHQQARGAAKEMYEKIEFRTTELVVEDGVREWSMASIT